MARVLKNRTKYVNYPPGFLEYRFSEGGTIVLDQNSLAGRLLYYVDSYVGRPISEGNFNCSKSEEYNPGLINGGTPPSGGTAPFHYAVDYLPPNLGGLMLGYDTGGWPTVAASSLVAETMARTNPSRPFLNPGQMLQDLYDLPKLYRQIGDLLKSGRSPIGLKGVANNALAAKFGWIPLLDDITKLLQVVEKIEERHAELDRLYSGSGLKRRVRLRKVSNQTQSVVAIKSGYPLYAAGGLQVINRVEQWGTIRWKPTSRPTHYPDDAQRAKLARRMILGLTASGAFASAWDVIPWTWLLGWVANVRSYVLAHGNTVPCEPDGKICIMTQVIQERYAHRISIAPGYSAPDGNSRFVWKFRNVFSKPSLSAYLPYIEGGRLSTLSLLAVQRIRTR